MSGAKGLIGGSLNRLLTENRHQVVSLSRSLNHKEGVFWDSKQRKADISAFEGFNAVVHLAGEPIAGLRWTVSKKKKIRESRVGGTRFLAEILSKLKNPPSVFICASAIGFYGDRGEEMLTEESAPGNGFLPEVCKAWEAACQPAKAKGIRVVHTRFGVVLAKEGGALKAMLPAFRLGVAGPIGNGQQFLSWVSLPDTAQAIRFMLSNTQISGAVNVTAPQPTRNEEFTEALAKQLHRPAFLRLPAPLARLAMGEMADAMLLASMKVIPQKLTHSGFHFEHPALEKALKEIF